MQRKKLNVRKLATIGVLAALASGLMYLEFPLPLMPPFLKIDPSGVPVLLASFMFGPLAGVAAAGVKALVHLFVSQTAGVGELADFLMTGSFAITAGLVYRLNKSKKGALIALAAGSVVLVVVSALSNYYILLPFYSAVLMPMEQIIAFCQSINPKITDISSYIVWGVLPFNIIKGIVLSVLTFLVYKHISKAVKGFTEKTAAQTGME